MGDINTDSLSYVPLLPFTESGRSPSAPLSSEYASRAEKKDYTNEDAT